MSQDKLHHVVEELRHEINALPVEDQESRAHISELLQDLEQQADALDQEVMKSAQAKMPTLIERFEVEHPRLTQVLHRVVVTLQDMGI